MGMQLKPRMRVKAEDVQVGMTLAVAPNDIAFRYVNRVIPLDAHHVIIVTERGDAIVKANHEMVWMS